MKIFNSISDFKSNSKTIVTIGTFDGVHIGHKKILEKLIKSTSNSEFESLVLTFFPHPRLVLQTGTDMKQLNTIDEKVNLLDAIGIDNLVIHPFNKEFSRLTAEDFVKSVLVDTFNVAKIIIGYDHRFGRNRTADINDLIEFGEKYNFEVEQISAEEVNDVSVSSTKIRNALNEGDVTLAQTYLDYYYLINGTVTKGKQLGKTIGFPTANISVKEDYKLIPKDGVYVVSCEIDSSKHYGMMNIGVNPTVEANNQNQKIEVHLFDFEKDIYGKPITVSLLKRLRNEQKFESIDALKKQLALDKINAVSFVNSLKTSQ
ncbi:bifunctional riboflavin kinase/FAD synthetase [Flavobacterium capsici]|uniref:Riboflavin biosynthesis protein n=1 Tax=Flavobacterium capsici TaxID=3075618 RepID=A0AA96F1T1_9FLAO|nr:MULTISPECIES: bifunctional riboflavin kinase/FAD synthetase [unclassified Flavobacterium]WNM19811.1 bifunctional riboflavin kinase/FAD synthetase [Flavobacterium sp. PMR2A8]WNM21200.1 bifunctional riboflavin kinase/FAD synthetase [Flavobacterium sp. PMTSA4]